MKELVILTAAASVWLIMFNAQHRLCQIEKKISIIERRFNGK